MGWIKVRTIALVASMAALLSILIAGINGVPLLRLLFRAFLSALLFGGISLGVAWLVHQFLPELTENREDGDDEIEPEAALGSKLDIKDDQEAASPEVQGAQNLVQAAQDEAEEDSDEPALQDEKPKIKPLAGEQPDFQQGNSLPDIESFSGDFSPDDIPGESNEPRGGSQSSAGSSSAGGFDSPGGASITSSDDQARSYFTEHSTPEEMAKAVRTVVKRDEE